MKNWLYSENPLDIDDNTKNIIFDNLPIKYRTDKYLNAVIVIVHRLSNIPWYTQEEVLDEINLNKDELIKLNEVIRESVFLQDLIIKRGLGRKYWNTISPFSNLTKNVINHKYNFPFRIAIFPGLSCMFFCGFCGRNQKARYPGSLLKDGNKRFENIFKNLPNTSAISISGGLEPLTNPQLGNLISYAKSLGIRVPLITNGHSLTPNYLKKHTGMWNLDSLRISLYGIDEESYDFITRKPGSYELVKNNTINFLKERNKINSNLKFGFNYIIIPETIDHMPPLLNLISEINSKVDNGPGVDFLTLREDFGSVTEGSVADDENRIYRLENFITVDDRKTLIKTFKDFNELQQEICPDLHVDFGYALVAISEGKVGKSLLKVDGTKMRKSGFPQLSVAVDLNGDIFLYREAGFLDRPGNSKFILGRISEDKPFEDVIREFVESKEAVVTVKHDNRFMDSFDHLLTMLTNQAQKDSEFGVPFDLGPVKDRCSEKDIRLGNNWYK